MPGDERMERAESGWRLQPAKKRFRFVCVTCGKEALIPGTEEDDVLAIAKSEGWVVVSHSPRAILCRNCTTPTPAKAEEVLIPVELVGSPRTNPLDVLADIVPLATDADETADAEWETVNDNSHGETHRLKVPGGWLYRDIVNVEDVPLQVHETFVPDTAGALNKMLAAFGAAGRKRKGGDGAPDGS